MSSFCTSRFENVNMGFDVLACLFFKLVGLAHAVPKNPARLSVTMQHSDKRTELATALVLNGHIPATILDEVAELMGLEVGEGDGSHSSRGWKRRIQQTITVPDLYYAEMPFPDGEAKHTFRLPSVKARELWQRNSKHFHMPLQHVPGRVESSGNFETASTVQTSGASSCANGI